MEQLSFGHFGCWSCWGALGGLRGMRGDTAGGFRLQGALWENLRGMRWDDNKTDSRFDWWRYDDNKSVDLSSSSNLIPSGQNGEDYDNLKQKPEPCGEENYRRQRFRTDIRLHFRTCIGSGWQELNGGVRSSWTILVNLELSLALSHHFHGYSQIFKI